MFYENYSNPIINNYRRTTEGSLSSVPISNEQHVVINNKVALKELPDPVKAISITNFNEVKDEDVELTMYQFRVDYTNGIIYFHPDNNGKNVTITSYYGLGATFFPASRVWLEVDGQNNVSETLGDIKGQIGNLQDTANQATIKVNEAKTISAELDSHTKAGKELLTEIKTGNLDKKLTDVATATQNLNTATGNANTAKSELNLAITDSKSKKAELVQTISHASTSKSDYESYMTNIVTPAKEKLATDLQDAKNTQASLTTLKGQAETVKTGLDASIVEGKQVDKDLKATTLTANNSKSALDTSTQNANQAKTNLDSSKTQAETLKGQLDNSISTGTSLDSSLVTHTSQAQEIHDTLTHPTTGTIKKANNAKDTLTAEITKAEQTDTVLKETNTQSDVLKQRLEEIIASGDLGQYVTDPKLANTLVDYAKKTDLDSKYDDNTQFNLEEDSASGKISLRDFIKNMVMALRDFQEKKLDKTELETTDIQFTPSVKQNLKQFYNSVQTTFTEVKQDLQDFKNTKGKANGIASLGTDGKIPSAQLPEIPPGVTKLSELEEDETHRLVTDTEKQTWSEVTNKANKTEIKTKLSEMTDDSTHRLVTDADKENWNKKIDVNTEIQYGAELSEKGTLSQFFSFVKRVTDGMGAFTETKGQKNGLASLDGAGKVPNEQLPDKAISNIKYLKGGGTSEEISNLAKNGDAVLVGNSEYEVDSGIHAFADNICGKLYLPRRHGDERDPKAIHLLNPLYRLDKKQEENFYKYLKSAKDIYESYGAGDPLEWYLGYNTYLSLNDYLKVVTHFLTEDCINATSTLNGFMSSEDKKKLDGISTGANKNTVINDLTTGGIDDALSAEQGKVLKGLIDNIDFTEATTAKSGLMSSSDKTKLNAYEALSPDKKNVYKEIEKTDFNNLTKAGLYTVNTATNAPDTGSYWSCIVLNSTSVEQTSYVQQIAIKETDHSCMYLRRKNASTWSSWTEIGSSKVEEITLYDSGSKGVYGTKAMATKVGNFYLVTIMSSGANIGQNTIISFDKKYAPIETFHFPASGFISPGVDVIRTITVEEKSGKAVCYPKLDKDQFKSGSYVFNFSYYSKPIS